MDVITTFPRISEWEKAKAKLDTAGLEYRLINPHPGYSRVGMPAIVINEDTHRKLSAVASDSLTTCGWVDYYPSSIETPNIAPQVYENDIVGNIAVMVLAPCVADITKIRLIAHISGDLGPVFQYLNAELPQACYNKDGQSFTYMDGYRMVSLYPYRIALAKIDGLPDGWRLLETLRRLANSTWSRRNEITPTDEMRQKPPALEIYKRLPGTNCRECGEMTCIAFALRLWSGDVEPALCKPIYEGKFRHLQTPLLEICRGLGLAG
jgi:ArsR family metal-binding transcriptional regulator